MNQVPTIADRRLIAGLATLTILSLIAVIGLTLLGYELGILFAGAPTTSPGGPGGSATYWWWNNTNADPLVILR